MANSSGQEPEYLDSAAAAKMLRVSRRTAQKYASSGKLKARRNPLNGRLMIDREAIEKVAAGEPIPAAAATA